MKYVSEIIGEEYKCWEGGQVIFITAPTGTGKTTFVLDYLVEFAAKYNRKILYLVNRKILKKQLEEKVVNQMMSSLRLKSSGMHIPKDIIVIETYQTIERMIQNNEPMLYYNQFDYIIADEAHHFYHDATYNTSTCLSYKWILEGKRRKPAPILVFISATMSRVKNQIVVNTGRDQIYDSTEEKREFLIRWNRVIEYNCDADYSYIDLKFFDKVDEITGIISSEKKEKWLLFVSSIKQGELLEKQLLGLKIDVVFIDAKYDKNIESMAAVEQVAVEKKISNQVVIATSVLDNGVSIEDDNLRNLIVMADTKDDFLQMIGRKRVQNQEKIKLYICKRSKGDFEKRLRYYVLPNVEFIEQYNNLYKNPNNGYLTIESFDFLLRKILQSQKLYSCAQRVCYVINGYLFINQLAVGQFDYLNVYYRDLIKRFETEGEEAFLNQQAEWIGVSDLKENFDHYVVDKQRKCMKQISECLNSVINNKLNIEANIKLKIEIQESILYLLKLKHLEEDMKKEIDMLKKNDRPFTYTSFNKIMCVLDFEFHMNESRGEPYIILSNKIN